MWVICIGLPAGAVINLFRIHYGELSISRSRNIFHTADISK